MYKIGHILFGARENIEICQFEKKFTVDLRNLNLE